MKDTFSVEQGVGLRMRAALNPGTPTNLLDSLSMDSVSGVRERVALNPSTPRELLYRMAQRETDIAVLWHLASNPNTPPVALQELVNRSFVKVEKS